jgi:Flp pilus assembly protein TadG
MTERASTLEFRKELGTARGPSWPFSRARRLGRLLRRSERGTAVVEFALVVAPLFLIVFGVLDFGRALNYYNDMTQLAGQGARAAAVNQNVNGTPADTSFQQALAAQEDSPELKGKVGVCIVATPTKVGDPVTVKTSYVFNFLSFLGARAGITSVTLSSTQTERAEVVPTAGPGYSSGNDIHNAKGTC